MNMLWAGHVVAMCLVSVWRARGRYVAMGTWADAESHRGQSTVHRDAAETALAYGRRDAWAVGGLTLSRRRPPYSCSLYSSIGPAT